MMIIIRGGKPKQEFELYTIYLWRIASNKYANTITTIKVAFKEDL